MTQTPNAPAPALEAQDSLRCLVVDDEPHLRRVLVRLMQSDGFNCEEAGNGAEALVSLARRPVHLVLTDLHMPELDGIGLLREIRARYPDTAVMLITAVADVSTAVNCLAVGAMDYLTKPFHLEEVRARVRQALEKRRLILENRDYWQLLEEKVRCRRAASRSSSSRRSSRSPRRSEVKDPYAWPLAAGPKYSTVIARLGARRRRRPADRAGGKVHDIGKIVRESVLNKAGPLTDEEYQHIMTHPVVGWRNLSPILSEMPMALTVVRSHHERFDGRGIPDGLAGLDIPLEARIAAVADTFDAMTSERPYRPGVPLQATIAELRRCSGAQFDPDVVDAFLTALHSGAIDKSSIGEGSHAAGFVPMGVR
jgi:response regulator RpfG family c-di-GMP phosphodiesterase